VVDSGVAVEADPVVVSVEVDVVVVPLVVVAVGITTNRIINFTT